jgi:hypothetical protein
MSSILDALRKLEAERAANRQAEQQPREFRAETAEAELTGNTGGHGWSGRHASPVLLVVGGLLVAVVLVTVSVSASIAVMNARTPVGGTPSEVHIAANPPLDPPQTEAAAATAPAAAAEVQSPAPEASAVVEPAPEDVAPPVPEPAPEPVQAASPPVQVAQAGIVPPVSTTAAPAPPVVSLPPAQPAPPPVVEPEAPATATRTPTQPERAAPRPSPPPPPSVPFKPEKLDVQSLPLLRPSERPRYGLEGVRMNMLRDISDTRPYGQAIINLDRVMVGDMIPNTDVRLIAIDERNNSIAIETSTGGRFQFKN